MKISFLFFLILFKFSHPVFAEIGDKVPACRVVYDAEKKVLLRDLDRLETAYIQYRWSEFKIRLFEYNRLWRARTDSNDPLSQSLRSSGQREEERLLFELKRLDLKSRKYAGQVEAGLKKLFALNGRFESCCADLDVKECYEKSFSVLSKKAMEVNASFQTIFEGDRAYRKEVELTIGGRDGLYPEDTVEPSIQHVPFFARYERERREVRFNEDEQIAESFTELRKILMNDYAGDLCCLGCGKTDWANKEDQIFNE